MTGLTHDRVPRVLWRPTGLTHHHMSRPRQSIAAGMVVRRRQEYTASGMAGGTGCHETTTTKIGQQHTQHFCAAASTEKCRCCIAAEAKKVGGDNNDCGAGGLERPNSGRDWREAQSQRNKTRAVAKEARDCAGDFGAKLGHHEIEGERSCTGMRDWERPQRAATKDFGQKSQEYGIMVSRKLEGPLLATGIVTCRQQFMAPERHQQTKKHNPPGVYLTHLLLHWSANNGDS